MANPCFLDLGLVVKLLATRFMAATITNGELRGPAEEPDIAGNKIIVQLIEPDFSMSGSKRSDGEPDSAVFTLLIFCQSGSAATSAHGVYALDRAASEIRKHMTASSIDDTATTGHVIHFGDSRLTHESFLVDTTLVRCATLEIQCSADRVTGDTFTS